MLLDHEKSKALLEYIERDFDALVDEDSIIPTDQEETALFIKNELPETIYDVEKLIDQLSEESAHQSVQEKIRTAKILARNPRIARLVKERVSYVCEICGAIPFKQKNGGSYAEAHHIEELAQSKRDDPKKMISVCPTCHRVIHYGDEESFRQRQSFK